MDDVEFIVLGELLVVFIINSVNKYINYRIKRKINKMKKSNYNRFLTLCTGEQLVFNSISCSLAKIDSDFFELYNKIEKIQYEDLNIKQKEIFNNMLEGQYITYDEVDEIKVLQHRYFSSKFSEETLSLTIAPTLECNFRCPYCYEVSKKGKMAKEVQDAIVDIVKKRCLTIKKLYICWYGGEPLLEYDIILDLSKNLLKICKEMGVEYSAAMITNGYLINEQLVEQLKACSIDSYQITIDGPPNIHNKRRIKKGCDTYTKLIENIKILLKKGLETIIRVNVDHENARYIEELSILLEKEDIEESKVYLGHVRGGKNEYNCMSCAEFAEFEWKYLKIFKDKGFNKEDLIYPELKGNYCGADNINSFVIDPNGYVYKCWNDIGIEKLAFGNILHEDKIHIGQYMNNINYLTWSPFEYEKCITCSILPICMGGCPWNCINQYKEPECEKWKYIIEDVLIERYNIEEKNYE